MNQIRDSRTASSTDSLLSRPWRPAFATAVLAAAVLAACGGGGGGGSSTPTVTTGTVKVSGVAATGAAVAGAAVSMACASGTGTATTGTDGSYTVNVTDGALPCVLEATNGSTKLHGVALGSGAGTVTVHLTPLTELVMANILGQDPATFFAAVKAGTASIGTKFTDASIASASAAVKTALAAAGVDASTITDLFAGELKAGTGTGYDGVLDALGAKLRAGGSKVSDLAAVLAAASAASTSQNDGSTTGMLPVASLFQTAASNCTTLRSGEYWRLTAKPSTSTGPTDPVTTVTKVTIDAAAAGGPTITAGATSETLTAVSGQTCRFTSATGNGNTDFMISPSGIGFARSDASGDATQRLQILLPVQSVAVSALAGKWNGMGWYPRNGVWSSDSPVATIQADGKWSSVCPDDGIAAPEASCTSTESTTTGFVANPDGGFDAVIHGLTHRGFAYQSGNGTKLIVLLHANGGFEFLTPSRNRAVAAVGTTWSAWDLRVDSTDVAADAVDYTDFQITASDATNKTESRKVTFKSAPAGLSYTQSYQTDTARTGWAYRAGGATTNSQGGSTTVAKQFALSTGLGFTPYALTDAPTRFGVSVTQAQ